jgi:hypothetical protein
MDNVTDFRALSAPKNARSPLCGEARNGSIMKPAFFIKVPRDLLL